MAKSLKLKPVLIGIALMTSLTACSQLAVASPPDVEFQDVSLSLATVNVEDHLHLFEYDRSLPLDIQVVRSWRRYNVTVTELTFASPRGGERVPTLLFEPDGEGPFAGLVLMHGAPGQKENFNDLGVHYARYGFVAIAIDAPQFRSDHNIGHVSMALIWPRFEEMDVEEQSQLMIDLQRAVDVLLTRETVDPDRLTYIGGSYGGAIGGLFAGLETRLQAYVLKVGDGGIIEHMSEPDDQGYPVHMQRWVNLLWPLEPLHYVGRAAPAQLLFQNGLTDSYVPTSDTLRYYQAASEPKTIMWYNTGHFLPQRHYYDHLRWQHELIGVDTILLKPFFAPSGIVYDALLMIWFIVSGLCMPYVAWDLRAKSNASWFEVLAWLPVILVLGPVGLLARLIIRRNEEAHNGPTSLSRALSASLWMVTFTMIGMAVVQQTIFVTVYEWQIKLALFFFVPQIIAGLAQLLNRLIGPRPEEGRLLRASLILPYIASSTLATICAYVMIDVLGRAFLHFGFPVYHPLKWFEIMLASIVAVLVTFPLHLLLHKRGLALWGMSPVPLEQVSEEQPRYRWYEGLGAALGAYLALFLIQAAYVTTYTPNYITFLDVIKMMLGIE